MFSPSSLFVLRLLPDPPSLLPEVCSTLTEKFGKHGLVKAKPTVRSLAVPMRMDDGMDEGAKPKKKVELIDGPMQSERGKVKLDKRNRDCQIWNCSGN